MLSATHRLRNHTAESTAFSVHSFWFDERTDSVFNFVNVDSVKQALGHYCLDEGRGVYDSNKPLNVEVVNQDVARSKDVRLQEAISESKSVKLSAIIKK